MYWFRDPSPLSILPWLAVCLAWISGGWLIATHAFQLERRERLLAGIGLGLAGYLWSANLLGRWLAPTLAFSLAGVLVLLAGLVFAWKGQRPVLDRGDLRDWPILVVGLLLVWLFARIGQGLMLFDEHKNLSIISTMATGDIPPHFYMNPAFYFSYHYGFQLLGASLMRLGGLFAWSAFDLSKALVGTYSILLAYLIGQRYIQQSWGGLMTALIFTFSMGTRYLMLLLPRSTLLRIDPLIQFDGASSAMGYTFSQSLTQPWVVDGGPPFPFAFAFNNGITSWPRFMAIQAGPSSLGIAMLLLVWLLSGRTKKWASLLPLTAVFAIWALAWESGYALVVTGAGLLFLYRWYQTRSRRVFTPEVLSVGLSVPVAVLQGGTITEMLRKAFFGSSPAQAALASQASTATEFALRWPPAIISSHLGALKLTSPLEALVALFELGPAVLFTPWITIWAWRRFQRGEWFTGVLMVSAWIGFLMPIFFSYKSDRDITRLSAHALEIWIIFLLLAALEFAGRGSGLFKKAAALALGLAVFGGVVVSGITLTAADHTAIAKQMDQLDAQISRAAWDKLPENSQVFDPQGWHVAVLLGQPTLSAISTYVTLPEWDQLLVDPSLKNLLAAGYNYLYITKDWWKDVPYEDKQTLSDPCVRTITEVWSENRQEFRRLVDLRACQSQTPSHPG